MLVHTAWNGQLVSKVSEFAGLCYSMPAVDQRNEMNRVFLRNVCKSFGIQ